LRLQIGPELGDDVVLPLPGQVLLYGLEVTIKKFHGVFLFGVPGGWSSSLG
jgi:hypothetical protein